MLRLRLSSSSPRGDEAGAVAQVARRGDVPRANSFHVPLPIRCRAMGASTPS